MYIFYGLYCTRIQLTCYLDTKTNHFKHAIQINGVNVELGSVYIHSASKCKYPFLVHRICHVWSTETFPRNLPWIFNRISFRWFIVRLPYISWICSGIGVKYIIFAPDHQNIFFSAEIIYIYIYIYISIYIYIGWMWLIFLHVRMHKIINEQELPVRKQHTPEA